MTFVWLFMVGLTLHTNFMVKIPFQFLVREISTLNSNIIVNVWSRRIVLIQFSFRVVQSTPTHAVRLSIIETNIVLHLSTSVLSSHWVILWLGNSSFPTPECKSALVVSYRHETVRPHLVLTNFFNFFANSWNSFKVSLKIK